MSRKDDGLKKSLGSTIPAPFRLARFPGQVPDKQTIRELTALTAMPSRRMKLVDTAHPYMSSERVVEGLGQNRGWENDWSKYISKAMEAPNELVMRQSIMVKAFDEKLDPGLRRELLARSLSLWKENRRIAKSVDVVKAGDLRKAGPFIGPRGGKWKDSKHTVPWEEGKSIKKDSELSTPELQAKARAALEEKILPLVQKFSPSVKNLTLEAIKEPRGASEDSYEKKLFGEVKHMIKVTDALKTRKETVIKGGHTIASWNSAFKRLRRLLSGYSKSKDLKKSDPRGGTYVKRVPKPGGGYRYFYDEDKYNSHAGAHVTGSDAAEKAITKAVGGHVRNAGKAGCELKSLKALAKRYGADVVGDFLNRACGGGALRFVKGRLFPPKKKRAKVKKTKKETKKSSPAKAKPKAKPEKKAEKAKQELKKSGPYVGPRGGKWADVKHTIPWKEGKQTESKQPKIQSQKEKMTKTVDGETSITEHDVEFSTGKPVTFNFVRSTEAAPKLPRGGEDRFQQRIEPAGRYMTIVSEETSKKPLPNQISGKITFNKPLVIKGNTGPSKHGGYDEHSWKVNLSRAYGGKKGKALSRAVAKDGYDGIVTVGRHGTSETIDLRFLHTGVMEKSAPHKYVRRVPKPGGGYRYFYRESAAAREATAGEEVRLGKRMVKVVDVTENGTITLEIAGKRQTVSPKQWHNLLTRHYGRAFVQGAQRRAQQTINAVMRHVPRALLEDLKGNTDEERLADLEKRVPAVYDRLKAAFSRAGMSPHAAKRSLGMVLERRGWKPEARALVIGTVLRHRQIGTRDLIQASENLAGGRPVHEGHVAAVVELRAPGGKPEAFPASVAAIAKDAEADSAKLSSLFAEKPSPEKAGKILEEVMNSEAVQKLLLITQAYPGLVDQAVEPVRKAILRAGSTAAKKAPTTEGSETIVYVAGEGGKPKALEARYRLVEADSLTASHDPQTFSRRTDYPQDVQERAYHRDKAEQAKVIRNAQKMDPRFVVNTNPDAVNGPPMVTPEGIVLGGNSRAMSMQRIYEMHPEKADEMRQYLESHAIEAGLTAEDVRAMKNPVLIREVKVEDKSKAGMQLLVRQMNESFTQGMDPRTMQVAMGRKLTDRTLAALADSMTEDETLNSFLASSRSERFVGSLFQAGIIDNRNVNQYMMKGTRTLNNDGRTLVSRILVGRTVDDADVLSDTGTQMMDSIAGSVPSMVQAASHGEGFDLGGDLGVAVDAFNDLQRRVDKGTLPALDPKMSAGALNRLYNYFNVLPGIGEPHPVIRNDRAQILLEVLIRKRGPVQMAKVFREYARIAAANPEGQTAMFGAKTTPMDALKQATGDSGGEKEPQMKLVASMTAREDRRFVLGGVS